MTTEKTIDSTRRTFVGKVMSLLFNMLSKLIITFLPRSKCLLISWLQSPYAVILEPQKILWHCFHCLPIYFPWSDGTGCHDLRFLNVELQASFFTLLQCCSLWGHKDGHDWATEQQQSHVVDLISCKMRLYDLILTWLHLQSRAQFPNKYYINDIYGI